MSDIIDVSGCSIWKKYSMALSIYLLLLYVSKQSQGRMANEQYDTLLMQVHVRNVHIHIEVAAMIAP